jgi:hypothetical protein
VNHTKAPNSWLLDENCLVSLWCDARLLEASFLKIVILAAFFIFTFWCNKTTVRRSNKKSKRLMPFSHFSTDNMEKSENRNCTKHL